MENKQYKSLSDVPRTLLTNLITAQEAAEIRGITVYSIWELIRRGRLACHIIGGRKYVLKSEIENFKMLPRGVKPKAKQKTTKREKNGKKRD
jgi:hypothetical protein